MTITETSNYVTPDTECSLCGHFHTTGSCDLWSEGCRCLGNLTAREGCSRCDCGCKYWENDHCIDCGTQHDPRHDAEE